MAYSVTGRVSAVGAGPDDTLEFTMKWDLIPAAQNGHSASEEGGFFVDATLTDTEVEALLRTLVAERVSTRANISLIASDVRGCKL
jgi:hypothetical protein